MSDKRGETSVGLDTAGDGEGLPHPWPYLKEFFEIVGSKNDSWQLLCKLCTPKTQVIHAFKTSPSNLKKHIEVSCFLSFFLKD